METREEERGLQQWEGEGDGEGETEDEHDQQGSHSYEQGRERATRERATQIKTHIVLVSLP